MSDTTISPTQRLLTQSFVEYLDTAAKPGTKADGIIGLSDLKAAEKAGYADLVDAVKPGLEANLTTSEAVGSLSTLVGTGAMSAEVSKEFLAFVDQLRSSSANAGAIGNANANASVVEKTQNTKETIAHRF